MIRVVVPGTPVPQGSHVGFVNKRTRRVVVKDSNQNLDTWRDTVTLHLRHKSRGERYGKWAPVEVDVLFCFGRPKSVRRIEHVVKPDVDKLMRAILDALTMSGVIVDDAQVVRITAEKVYSHEGSATVTVRLLVR